jgi:seryl-tRNA synthetase
MHDIRFIRDNPEAFDAGLKRRGLEPMSAALLAIDERRRAAILASEQAQARRNAASKEIGEAKKAKDETRAAKLMEEVAGLKTTMPELEAAAKAADEELAKELAAIPNLPLNDVPDGIDEHGNVQRHVFGKIRNYAFNPKPHDDLGAALGYMDFETAAKLSGARFVVLKKGLAKLERAIGRFMLDLHTNEHGYTEIDPPLLVRDDVMFGTGQLPKFESDQFQTTITDVDPLARENLNLIIKAGLQFLVDHDNKLGQMEIELDDAEKPTLKHIAPILGQRILETAAAFPIEYARAIGIAHQKQRESERRLWLIPTAEVSLTNLVRKSILDEKELPMRLTALTPCFRAEAGAAGRDTRGSWCRSPRRNRAATSMSGCWLARRRYCGSSTCITG